MPSIDLVPVSPLHTGVIPIHFNVSGHFLPLRTFIETTRQTQNIVDAINGQLFGGALTYQVLVLPPEPGTFLAKLKIAGQIVVGTFIFLESDIGKGLILSLTGHEPRYWAEQVGPALRERMVTDATAADTESASRSDFLERTVGEMIMAEATKSFLQKDVSELSRAGADPKRFRDAYEARNLFYKSCYDDRHVSGLGFTEAEEFPIKRSDFARLQVSLPPKEEEDEGPWHVTIDVLRVTSPVWDRDDKQRLWKGRDADGRDRYFKIEDENFWDLVKEKRLNPDIIDTIKVQWAYHENHARPKDARVLRVLEYNGEHLAEPLDENALNALLGPYQFGAIDPDEPSFL